MSDERGKEGTYLDDTSTAAGGIEEMVREPEESRTPVHHRHLEFGACGAASPLCVRSVYAYTTGVAA